MWLAMTVMLSFFPAYFATIIAELLARTQVHPPFQFLATVTPEGNVTMQLNLSSYFGNSYTGLSAFSRSTNGHYFLVATDIDGNQTLCFGTTTGIDSCYTLALETLTDVEDVAYDQLAQSSFLLTRSYSNVYTVYEWVSRNQSLRLICRLDIDRRLSVSASAFSWTDHVWYFLVRDFIVHASVYKVAQVNLVNGRQRFSPNITADHFTGLFWEPKLRMLLSWYIPEEDAPTFLATIDPTTASTTSIFTMPYKAYFYPTSVIDSAKSMLYTYVEDKNNVPYWLQLNYRSNWSTFNATYCGYGLFAGDCSLVLLDSI